MSSIPARLMHPTVRRNPIPDRRKPVDEQPGLFRRELLGPAQAGTVRNLFSDLKRVSRGEFLGEDLRRHLQGSRVLIDRSQGHGTWELYRLDDDLYVVAGDGVYDSARREVVPGEGLVEFHLRVAGTLTMSLPGHREPLVATGPCLLILHQPQGVDVLEEVVPKVRDTGVSLYCRPEYLSDLARRNAIVQWSLLQDIQAHQGARSVWYRVMPLSPGLLYVARSLLQSPYRRGIRLLHAEAKSLEIMCEVLRATDVEVAENSIDASDAEIHQLDVARQMLATQLDNPPSIAHVARVIGMSESKLKRRFKYRYGMTVFDYGLDCRMRHALDLLRHQRFSVGQVAHAVGYRHQTSFASAFRDFFGFLPRRARKELP